MSLMIISAQFHHNRLFGSERQPKRTQSKRICFSVAAHSREGKSSFGWQSLRTHFGVDSRKAEAFRVWQTLISRSLSLLFDQIFWIYLIDILALNCRCVHFLCFCYIFTSIKTYLEMTRLSFSARPECWSSRTKRITTVTYLWITTRILTIILWLFNGKLFDKSTWFAKNSLALNNLFYMNMQ